MTDQVVIGWVHPGHVSGRFMDSVLRLMYQSGNDLVTGDKPYFTVAGHTHVESGPRIATARNEIVTRFLEKEAWKDVEWLFMVDSDMTFDGLLLNRLLKTARPEGLAGRVEQPVVGGLCFGGGHGMMFPTMYRIVDPAENDGNPVTIVTDFAPDEVVKVDATGAACLLIHRGVLEHLATKYEEPHIWFAESVAWGRQFGEDWTFCLRVRKEGFEIVVDTGAKVGHMKFMELNEEMWRTGKSPLKGIAPPTVTAPPLNRRARRALAKAS